MKDRIMQVGSLANQINSTRENPQRQRVYDINYLAPTMNTCGGGGLMPYVVIKSNKTNRGGWKVVCSTTVSTTPEFTHFHKNWFPAQRSSNADTGIIERRLNATNNIKS